MTREELEAVPHPAAKGTLAWEQQHEVLEFDMDSECRTAYDSDHPCVCVQIAPSITDAQKDQLG